MRKTKIICTLGPAVDSEKAIEGLIRAGMDAARFNFSHGTHESHLATYQRLCRVRQAIGTPVAAILDTKGPEIRIREFAGGKADLKEGGTFTLTTEDVPGDGEKVSVTYPELHLALKPGSRVLLDDGLIALRVREIAGRDIRCTVETGGVLTDHKSINLPDTHVELPAITDRDIDDLNFAAENGFDFIAASFTRCAEDVRGIRKVLKKAGGEDIRIIAKIENREGVEHLDEILEAADGIMVARGDLGVEVPAKEVPVLQKEMIGKALSMGKLAVTATQMLDSMIRNPRPTRAEVSDVANAVCDGTGAVMLSGETASGKYPLEALKVMADVVSYAEEHIDYWQHFAGSSFDGTAPISDAITHACCMTAMDLDAKAILTATHSGHTARMIARFRPACPIAALTTSERVRRQLSLNWGTVSYLCGDVDSTDHIFELTVRTALEQGLVLRGDTVVITAGIPIGHSGSTNLIKAQVV